MFIAQSMQSNCEPTSILEEATIGLAQRELVKLEKCYLKAAFPQRDDFRDIHMGFTGYVWTELATNIMHVPSHQRWLSRR